MGNDHGQEIIRHALSLIEDGHFLEAVHTADQAFCYYLESGQENRAEGLVDALAVQVSAWQHLYEQTGQEEYAIRALTAAHSMEDVYFRYGATSRTGLVLHRLGTACMANKRYPLAEKYFDRALKSFQGTYQPEYSDWEAHLGEATFRAGDESAGLELIEEAADELTKSREQENDAEKTFLLDVWLSGAHLKIAGLLSATDREKALGHLASAEKIIEANPRLIIRKRQLDALTSKIK